MSEMFIYYLETKINLWNYKAVKLKINGLNIHICIKKPFLVFLLNRF
jgi:hypothetical protein